MVKTTGWSIKLVSIEKRFKPSVLKDAGIIERYGSGIKRILEWFSMYGLGQPVFEELQEGFRVTIYRTTQKTTQKFSTKEHILRLLKENPRLTRAELAATLGKSEHTISEDWPDFI